ncbi:MAG: hypothetical protein LBN09_05775 [Clostridioides sp.]|jgi:hypothetical protein|nr:hypothetical protein [Clostridioides sp.]
MWYDRVDFSGIEPLEAGDRVEIKGRVVSYIKGLRKDYVKDKFNYKLSFVQDNVKKIGNKIEDQKKIEFYTDLCKANSSKNHDLTLFDLKKMYSALERKDYVHKHLRESIRARILNNDNHEIAFTLNSRGRVSTKRKKGLYIKDNEIVLCKIGKEIKGIGLLYKDYVEYQEERGVYEGFDELDKWTDTACKWKKLSAKNKKEFGTRMKICEVVKKYLKNEIEYDHILVVNYEGKIYFITVDNGDMDKNTYLEPSEIELCRFGRGVKNKTNIYNDYSDLLREKYGILYDIDIWNLWNRVDNGNISKLEIIEKNFQKRKDGYLNFYAMVLKGIEKEMEKQFIS